MAKTKINVRVNSSLLYLFSQIGISKYNIKTVSKFFVNRLDCILGLTLKENFFSIDFNTPTLNYYKLNKIYTITIDNNVFKKLQKLSSKLNIDVVECFRRIISLTCLSEIYLFPQPNLNNMENRVKNDDYTKFRFGVNKEDLMMYKELFNKLECESNLTAALNTTIKSNISKLRNNDGHFLNTLLNEDIDTKKSDYKYNFTIPNKRFEDFYLACENIGVSPQECLRKSIALYIKDNSKILKKKEDNKSFSV